MPHPVDILVGRRVKERRIALGMTQSDLGEKLNVSFQQVQKYERGSNRMGASRLFDVAVALKIEVADLFEGLHDKDMIAGSAYKDANDLTARIMRHARKMALLPQKDQDAVLYFISAMSNRPQAKQETGKRRSAK